MKKIRSSALLMALRPNQWIKNFVLFAAIVFNGKLFIGSYFLLSSAGFIIFCALSSASYLLNDIIDLKYDRLHPIKKKRPLASGKLPVNRAIEAAFLLTLFGLIGAILLSGGFFLIAAAFVLLHVVYSLFLKKYAVLDILGIAFSFILRAFAGEMLTGYHLPFWLFLTIMFIALFIAATKRHAELLRQQPGKTRPALFQYKDRLLDSYTSMFGSASILAYALFSFLEEPPEFNAPFKQFLINFLPQALERKWMIITVPFVVYGLMRYAQVAYEGTQAERPEKIVTKDMPLIIAIIGWSIMIVMIIYIL